jgi:ABC-type nitrate/sulfonate/bicarbonate transport system substrate-binding protein
MSSPRRLRLALYCTGCIPGYHLPCFAGAAGQIFRRHRLTVEIVDPEPGPANVLAVTAGRYDMCLTSVAHFLNAIREEPALDARFIFMLARRSHMAAFVVEERAADHGRVIRGPADLDGASVLGEPDSTFVREYLTFLSRIGARPGPIIETPYDEIMGTLADGRGDVAADFVDLLPRFQAAADSTSGATIRALPFHESGLDIYGSGLVASGRLLRGDVELSRAAVNAFREAVITCRDDPELGLDALIEQIPTADPDLVIAGWKAGSSLIFDDNEPSSTLGVMNVEKWSRTIDFHADAYGTPRHIDPSSVFDDSVLALPSAT